MVDRPTYEESLVRTYRTMSADAHVFIVLAAAWVLVIWPILLLPSVHSQDYINHLSRAFILLNPDDRLLQANYRIEWTLTPNLAFDLVSVALGQFLPLEVVGRAFLVITSLLLFTGCAALHRSLNGTVSIFPILATPFLFNAANEQGFMAYLFGVGIALWAMAFWVLTPERRWQLRLLIATIFATVLYIAHFAAFGVYGLFVLGRKLDEAISRDGWRSPTFYCRFARDASQAMPAFAMLLLAGHFSSHPADSHGLPVVTRSLLDKADDIRKALDLGPDFISGIYLLLTVSIIAYCIMKGWARLDRRVFWPLLLFAVAFFTLPDGIGDIGSVDWRIIVPLSFVAVAALVPARNMEDRERRRLICLMGGLLVILSGTQAVIWKHYDDRLREAQTVIDSIPEGSRVFWAHTTDAWEAEHQWGNGLYHLGSYATLRRRALVQTTFAYPNQQPVRFRDPKIQNCSYKSYTTLSNIHGLMLEQGVSTRDAMLSYDYIFLHGRDLLAERVFGLDRLHVTAHRGDFWLFALEK
jgi:hypothetical protein